MALMARSDRLIIFGRYPVPGRTKTRLIPLLGAARAADFQRDLTERTLRTDKSVARRRPLDLEACFEGGTLAQLGRWLGPDLIFSEQSSGDLGERMKTSFLEAFRQGAQQVVLHGTDIPGLTAQHIDDAFEALKNHDLVLGPSTDGGYWLIGLKKPTDLFDRVEWGTSPVFEKTVAAARGQGLSMYVLSPLTDMDTGEAVKRWMPDWAGAQPYLSVIIPALNEEAHIEKTILNARSPDAEIIVVDGGSGDRTAKRAGCAGAVVITGPRGRALQQNRGAATARGGVLLFLHADTLLPKDYVAQVFETLMNRRVALGAFRFKTNIDRPLMKGIELTTQLRSRYLRLPYGDQALFVRKPHFLVAGGFPEMPIGEDLFFVRLVSKQGRIAIASAYAVTSGRRWKEVGLLRTTLINQFILAGFTLGISPATLAGLYHRVVKRKRRI
jgi:rSAM/selenodomain-associated transferase 2/rSAM/selenodomain-associated transferase 1